MYLHQSSSLIGQSFCCAVKAPTLAEGVSWMSPDVLSKHQHLLRESPIKLLTLGPGCSGLRIVALLLSSLFVLSLRCLGCLMPVYCQSTFLDVFTSIVFVDWLQICCQSTNTYFQVYCQSTNTYWGNHINRCCTVRVPYFGYLQICCQSTDICWGSLLSSY